MPILISLRLNSVLGWILVRKEKVSGNEKKERSGNKTRKKRGK
jgi:hypothetical protein